MTKAVVEALVTRVDAQDKRIEALEKDLASRFPDKTTQVKPSDKTKDGADHLSKDKKPKKDTKKPKTGADDKPKNKRITGYILFCNDARADVKTQLTVPDEKLKNTDVMTELARRWKALDVDDKEEWNDKAKAAKSGDIVPVVHGSDDDDDEDDDE